MKTKTTQTLLAAIALSPCLLAMSPEASAELMNKAQYQVTLTRVQSPNTAQAYVPGASETQSSITYAPYLSTPVPVTVAGSADTGTNMDGYGYASGHGFARAEAGVLAASAFAEGQAVANTTTNVGASATVTAMASFIDQATFTPVGQPWQNLLIVSGNLLLTGDMYGYSYSAGYYDRVTVGGTGLNQQSASAVWTGESTGQQKSAAGVYSPWTPGSPTSIPFSFTVYGGQPTDLSYSLVAYATAGTSFPKCIDSLGGGICDVGQVGQGIGNADYSHTLAWGGVTVTDWNGAPVNFSVSSKSGFDYANAYVAPVPVPAAVWLFGSGLLGLVGAARHKKAA